MATEHVPPTMDTDGFNCPFCDAFAQQAWEATLAKAVGQLDWSARNWLALSECKRCGKRAVWVEGQMVFPTASMAPLAHADMPPVVAVDYEEARTIGGQSPRGASALLRLALQKLCAELGEPGKHINDDIAALVRKGLLPQVQQSLDLLRVVGNSAVHPGQMDLKDDVATATALFGVMNVIVEQMIAAPKHTAALYASLPQGALQAIQERDAGPTTATP